MIGVEELFLEEVLLLLVVFEEDFDAVLDEALDLDAVLEDEEDAPLEEDEEEFDAAELLLPLSPPLSVVFSELCAVPSVTVVETAVVAAAEASPSPFILLIISMAPTAITITARAASDIRTAVSFLVNLFFCISKLPSLLFYIQIIAFKHL